MHRVHIMYSQEYEAIKRHRDDISTGHFIIL